MIHAVMLGVLAAVIVIILFALIWSLAKAKLERWSYDLNREPLNLLREAQRKLGSIERGQERPIAQLERIERLSSTVTTA